MARWLGVIGLVVAGTALATHNPAHAVGFTYEVECLPDAWRVTVTVDASMHPTVVEVNVESPFIPGGIVRDFTDLTILVVPFDVPKEEASVDFVARAIYEDGSVETTPMTAVRPDCPFPGTTTTTPTTAPPTAPPTTGPPPTVPPATPGFAFSIRSECRNDTPYIVYDASVEGIAPGTTMVLHFVDANGVEQHTLSVTLGSGEVLWPGAAIDANGDPTDWPGWVLDANGEWIEGADGFEWARPNITVYATVNPTSPAMALTYPPATPRCQAQPPDVGLGLLRTTLPATGDVSQRPLTVVGALLLAVGAGLLVITRHRRLHAAEK
jgi:LPXTG-motif cell wall-anchored protein